MKKLILLCAVMCAIPFATAQKKISFGPKVGMNVSNFVGSDLDASKRATVGLTAGAFIEYRPIKLLGISLDVLYSRQGVKYSSAYDFDKINQSLFTDNLNIPIMARFYCVKGLSVNVGLQPGFLLDANASTKEVLYGEVVDDSKENVMQDCKVFDLSVPVGISYAFKFGLVLDARYSIGVLPVVDSDIADFGTNSVFSITAGWKF